MSRYTGKYRKKPRVPLASWVLIAVALISLMVGGTVAYLSASTAVVENQFHADTPEIPVVKETFANDVKSDVKVYVGEPGYAVYVRAAVVVTWKDAKNGNVLGQMPVEGTDYTIRINNAAWFKRSDGFYYHKTMVNSGADTEILIEECKPNEGKAPSGYSLNVEIIAQTIQALGTTDNGGTPAVTDAWGVAVSNGALTAGT